MEESVTPATRKRRLLALYLDFVVFSVPWSLLQEFVLSASPELRNLSLLFQFATFTIIEVVFHFVFHWSPGEWLLSIRQLQYRATPDAPPIRAAFVNTSVIARESWFTLFAATLLLLDGSKGMVRWAMWIPPPPYFGTTVSDSLWPFVAITDGVVQWAVAYLLFRANPVVLFVGGAYLTTLLVSAVLSWPLWPAWAAEYVRRRREYQGLEIRPAEIEQAQSFGAELAVGGVVLYLIGVMVAGVLLMRRRHRIGELPPL
jgi:hypothetical protein